MVTFKIFLPLILIVNHIKNKTMKNTKDKEYYTYEVIEPIKDYGFRLVKGDLLTSKDLLSLPPFYRKSVKLLSSPILK